MGRSLSPAYFDYAASAPPLAEALRVWAQVSRTLFANPSSVHAAGRAARRALETARGDLLRMAGAAAGGLVLTSGGTEANNLVIRSEMDRNPRGRMLLAGDVHPSAWFARDRYPDRTDVVGVDASGRLSAGAVERALRPDTILCSIVHANNETGVVHPAADIAAVCRRRGVRLHCDGVQVLGHLPLDTSAIACDYYTFSGHKFGAPRGAGGVFVRGSPPEPLILGGGQENGVRAGTENVAAAAATARALAAGLERLPEESPRLRRLAALAADALTSAVPGMRINSRGEDGLPGLLSVSFPWASASEVVAEMDLLGFCVSAGSACHARQVEPSRTLLAMGRTRAEALGTVRISMGRLTTEPHVRRLTRALARVVLRSRTRTEVTG